MALISKPHNSVSYIHEPAQTSTPWLFSRVQALWGGATESPEGGAIAFPKGGSTLTGMLYLRKIKGLFCSMGEGLSSGILGADPQLSSQRQTPVSPHVTLAYSSLPVLEPRVSGCKQDLCFGP